MRGPSLFCLAVSAEGSGDFEATPIFMDAGFLFLVQNKSAVLTGQGRI